MDYTQVPRSLIYKERKNLNDFGVKVQGTLNHYLFTKMKRMTLLNCGDGVNIALQCLNNAYYICTLMQMDEYPELRMDKYEQKLMEVNFKSFPNDVYQASMALVCVLLAAYDDKYKEKGEPLIESIHHWTSHNKWMNSNAHKSFEDIIETCSADSYSLPADAFAPRDIIKVIENCPENVLWENAKYICERLMHTKDLRQQQYGVDMAIARLKGYQRELCKESDYNPKKNTFRRSSDLYDFKWEDEVRAHYNKSNEAIAYYMKFHVQDFDNHSSQPTTSEPTPTGNDAQQAEIEMLKQQLEQTKKLLDNKNEENADLKEKVAELSGPVESLTAEQKVRMEFGLQLLRASGLTDETLNKRGNRQATATIMSLLLGIRLQGKNPAQICANYLADRRYYPKRNTELLIKLNNLCAQLGIKVCLKLEKQ